MTSRQLIGLSPFAILIGILYAAPHAPYTWGHELLSDCRWYDRPSTAFLGPAEPDNAARAVELACWEKRGLKSLDWQSVKTIVRKFPDRATLAAWNHTDENGYPLSSDK